MAETPEIDRLARAICANLGLDPDVQVGCGWGADMTQAEGDYIFHRPIARIWGALI